jgi:hypothetical protein
MDNFLNQIISFFEDEVLRTDFINFLSPTEKDESTIVTAFTNTSNEIVFSVFSRETYNLINEMSIILNKPAEDIIKDLGPKEVDQFYFSPATGVYNAKDYHVLVIDQQNRDLFEDIFEECIDPECDCHDLDED